MSRFGFATIFYFLFLSCAYAGAWTVKERQWEKYRNFTFYTTDSFYDTDGTRKSQPRYTKFDVSSREEYGIYDDLTFGYDYTLSFVYSTTQLSPRLRFEGWNYGISDPKAYLRQRLWQDDSSIISTQATLKLPSLFNNDSLARSGSEEFTGELRVLGGHNFTWQGSQHFTNLEIGYEHRPQNDADLIHVDATVGFNFFETAMLMPQLFTTWRSGATGSAFTQNPDDAYNLTKAQFSAVFPLGPKLSLQAGAFHHLGGRNTGGGSGLNFGIWAK